MPYGRKDDALPEVPVTPELELEFRKDASPPDSGGFLRLERHQWVAKYADGTKSRPFDYDAVARRDFDAVVMLAYYRTSGEVYVYLRSSLRPPLLMRPEPLSSAVLWELPAGLIEPHEHSEGAPGRRETARRELVEELGFQVEVSALRELGPPVFPAVGVIAERHFGFAVEVEPSMRGEPTCDGSPLEHGGVVVSVSLQAALAACRRGVISDGKTELFLRRFADDLP